MTSSLNDRKYRNMVCDPILTDYQKRYRPYTRYKDFASCCAGLAFAATGDEAGEKKTELPSMSQKVVNLQAWNYAKTLLAIVGLYVVIKFIWEKLKTK